MKKIHALPWISLALVAVWLLSASLASAAEFTDNLVILLDSSGSMEGKKIRDAREAVKTAIDSIPDATNVGLLVFPEDKTRWTYPLGPLRKPAFKNAVSRVKAGGGTPLGAYMKVAADALLASRQKQHGYGTYRLLVITDGQAQDTNLVNRYTPDILSRGIRVDCIGVEMDSDHILATKVHSYSNVKDSAVLKGAISDVLAEVGDGGSDDYGGEDPYDLLASVPLELASAAINALASSGNHPIGESPQSQAAHAANQTNSSSQTSANTSQQPGTTVPPGTGDGSGFLMILLIIIAVVIVICLLAAMFGSL